MLPRWLSPVSPKKEKPHFAFGVFCCFSSLNSFWVFFPDGFHVFLYVAFGFFVVLFFVYKEFFKMCSNSFLVFPDCVQFFVCLLCFVFSVVFL